MTIDTSKRALLGAAGVMALGSVAALTSTALAATKTKARVIDVVAKKFEFVPGEIHAKLGEPLTLRFTTPEVPMGFNLADFNLRADLMPGKVVSVDLTPTKSGTFTFLCDVFCGTGHEDMSGTLIVT